MGDPKSDKEFFGPPFPADYPDDSRPSGKISKDFSHPYPDVQAANAYDEDFVKDENGDNGEWKAQAEYDILRGKIRKGDREEKRVGCCEGRLGEGREEIERRRRENG